ncbi:hypothetical protein KUTeg_017097 [Tegillarca granosa]|uniref:Peptidase M14 domain-containing protein n=1 Tax=Tegillarca granosa TaxID=220873 RepID=A0ABQ9ESK0_TEGGR|nr:hypothetical protein KUTeg_017097 [Tegillarca granosa]
MTGRKMADKKGDSGSESDSTEEPVVGNVNKFAVVPPGYNGRPKKGHLIFDACFESGNLGRVDYITEFEYDLFIRPDTCNPRFRVWFNFTVENVKGDQRVIFNIVNFSKTKSLYRDGMVRIPAKHVYYYRCPDHRKNYVMSFAFCFDKEDDIYQFSYCYPYSYTRLQNYLDNLEKKNYNFFTRELLCLTVQQRRLDMITITNPDNLDPEETKRIVFITARVHPGETPASYVCQGIIDFLISNHPIAKTLREHIVFKIVPMLNPDGVYLGNYRCSLMGFDLNRHWQEPSPWAHPTLYATKNALMEFDRMDFYIDLHAHSTLMNGFMYGNTYDDIDRYERQTLGGCLEDNSHCYTLEVSFFSYQTNSSNMKLGRNLARTFLDYYKLSGIISTKPTSSIVPKPGPYRLRDRQSERDQSNDVGYEESRQQRRSSYRNSEFNINNTNAFSETPTSIRLQLRDRENKRY